jgi:hypothetical protein
MLHATRWEAHCDVCHTKIESDPEMIKSKIAFIRQLREAGWDVESRAGNLECTCPKCKEMR